MLYGAVEFIESLQTSVQLTCEDEGQRQSDGCYQEQGSSRDHHHSPATTWSTQTHNTHPK